MADKPVWEQWALARITDPLDQPHPIDDGLPRRFWRPWHYGVLIATTDRAQWRGHLAAVPPPLRQRVTDYLAWIVRQSIDCSSALRAIGQWQQDVAQHRRCIAAAARRRRQARRT